MNMVNVTVSVPIDMKQKMDDTKKQIKRPKMKVDPDETLDIALLKSAVAKEDKKEKK